VPSQEVMHDYQALAGPMLEMNEVLRRKNRTLRQTCDLLLPRLISGEINVAAMEEEFAWAAA
jgi:type I restriction enzyme, S subunit